MITCQITHDPRTGDVGRSYSLGAPDAMGDDGRQLHLVAAAWRDFDPDLDTSLKELGLVPIKDGPAVEVAAAAAPKGKEAAKAKVAAPRWYAWG